MGIFQVSGNNKILMVNGKYICAWCFEDIRVWLKTMVVNSELVLINCGG